MNSLDQEFAAYKEQMEGWIGVLGLPMYQPPESEIEPILRLTREQLREKSSIALSECGVMLSQYAFFLQQKANECQTFLSWGKQVGNRISNEDKPRLVQWTRKVELRSSRIAYLTRRIEAISLAIANLAKTRYFERGS